ncbi:hypothetical protein [Methylobacterium sp. WSM2598]|nr:hypothetical protein [Methylobacterium sp. WSM2598]
MAEIGDGEVINRMPYGELDSSSKTAGEVCRSHAVNAIGSGTVMP